MIKIEVPGMDTPIVIEHLVLDYNGTIACDGKLIEGVADRIIALSEKLKVYILTADTYGTVRKQCEGLGAEIRTFAHAGAAVCKEEIVTELGEHVCAVGNGYNDIQMMDKADFSICVIDTEGACSKLINHSDIIVNSSLDALDLLLKTDRVRADLRN